MEMLRKKIGDFYLVEHIGAGGMSRVYLGLNPRTRQKRAVKILAKKATASPATYARFQREVQIIRTLSHPHIVRILDSGSQDACYYYMMELMTGGNLARRMARGRLPLEEAIRLFTGICSAMSHAHEKGIIHRDLKPANVLLSAAGSPMVSDFGIAKMLNGERASLTRSNEIMGTIAYLAPEQRHNTKRVDRRADVYALGALLYEMIMGFPPLGKFPWPGEMGRDYPSALQAILESCLSIKREQRFLHAGALLAEVESRLSGPGGKKFSTQANLPTYTRNTTKTASMRPKSDRIEKWFHKLRTGTTRERLGTVREMVLNMQPGEAKAILKLYPGEEDRVRWGLIRVLGELKVAAATPMILGELINPIHREHAIEALGNIGAPEAFNAIREWLLQNQDCALIGLMPLARTGKEKAIAHLRRHLSHEMAVVRQAAIQAMATIESAESLRILIEQLSLEEDAKVRATLQQSIHALQTIVDAPAVVMDRAQPA